MARVCFVCNKNIASWAQVLPIDEDLVKTWKLSKGLYSVFTRREGRYCPNCKNSERTIALARSIPKLLGLKVKCFNDFINYANEQNISIAEINSCGQLHGQLSRIDNLHYSEYQTGSESKKVPHEDIQELTYKDNSFDIVLHSETIEHIPDPNLAIHECRRVLKESGICIFTVPVIWNRLTLQRIEIENSTNVKYLDSKSYHGYGREDCIVWWEFGRDLVENLKVKVIAIQPFAQNYIFYTYKHKENESRIKCIIYRAIESIATTKILNFKQKEGKCK